MLKDRLELDNWHELAKIQLTWASLGSACYIIQSELKLKIYSHALASWNLNLWSEILHPNKIIERLQFDFLQHL